MIHKLRNRLVLSHILPMLIVFPLMGIALFYILETRYFLPNLTRELEADAILLAKVAGARVDIWQSSEPSQAFLYSLGPSLRSPVLLISPDGQILAAIGVEPYASALTEPTDLPDFKGGQVVTRMHYSEGYHSEIIEVLAPVFHASGRLVGVVEVSYRYETLLGELIELRYAIVAVLVVALMLGASIGYVLALNIGNPIQSVTQAVSQMALGQRSQMLREQGPDEIRMLVQAVNHFSARLQDLERSRRRLLANLVHELGRPLGALRAAVQALRQGAATDPALYQDLLAGMDQEMSRLQRLLEELAGLHEQVMGTLELDLEAVPLAPWLVQLLAPWQQAAREKGLSWEQQFPADLPTLQADPVRLGQAVSNLVANAIKYTPAGGKISTQAEVDVGQVTIRITDTGLGIPVEEQEKIFVPFYRGVQQGRFPQGMGLGLSIAQDIVLAHGGKIKVLSQDGQGSTFEIHLPTI